MVSDLRAVVVSLAGLGLAGCLIAAEADSVRRLSVDGQVNGDDEWHAKWIAPNRVTRPDADFGGARWISTADGRSGAVFTLERAPTGAVETIAHFTGSGGVIKINGRDFIAPCGYVRDVKRLRRGDAAHWLKAGTNVIEAVVNDVPNGLPRAVIVALRLPDRSPFVSGAEWTDDDGRPATVLGDARGVPWAGELDYSVEVASPAYEKRFVVEQPVAEAKLKIAAAGFYEAYLDGVKIGDKVLDPPPTDYSKRILYSEYPLSVAPGEHVLKILVGHGWYDMRTCATWNFDIAPWRNAPRVIAEMSLRHADGACERIGTDRTWRQVKSPVAYDDIREGEIAGAFDPRMPDLEADVVHPEEVPSPCRELVRSELPGTKKVREIRPSKIVNVGKGVWTVVFPETLAGWTRFTFRGAKKGDVITLRYDEHVDANYTPAKNRILDCFFYRSGSCGILPDGAFQQDRIVASGAKAETFEPRFVYHGFQFVHVFGLRTEPRLDDIVAYEVRTAFPRTGTFSCSDENLNRLVAMADASYRGNFVNGYPTDCPQREKLGWTGDAALACPFAQYLYENTAAYRKWIVDIVDAQGTSGQLPGIVPTSGWGYVFYNGPSWDYAIAEIPWMLYEHRGDRKALELAYPAVVKYVRYVEKKSPSGYLDWGLEDWHPMKTVTKGDFMSTAYFIRVAQVGARMAEVLGRKEDVAFFAEAERRSRAAFERAFSKGTGVYGSGGQTAQSVVLNFGLVPAGLVPAARARLVEAVRERDDHLDVGIQGLAHVLRALSDMGRTDLAYRVLTRDSSPSPLDWVKGGETTLGDYVQANAPSRNHVMYGDYVAWAFKYLAGIAPAQPGYERAVIEPRPIAALSFVKASTQTPRGVIRSEWRMEGELFNLSVSLPDGVSAEVRLPDGTVREIGGRTSTLTCRLPEAEKRVSK